jgi:hypothetical protein
VVLGVRFGGAAAYLTPFVAFVLIPLLDLLAGEDRVSYTPEEEKVLDFRERQACSEAVEGQGIVA